MPELEAPVFLAIVCPICQEVRFRSKRAFTKDDPPTGPADFEPEPGVPPADDNTAIPMCYVCNAVMVPQIEAESPVRGGVEVAPPAVTREARVRPLPSQPTSVRTLFQPDADETIITVKDTAKGIVVATNKRVVQVSV